MLKYIFTAVYSNGATYLQNQEDKSILEPEKRSCFFDVEHDRLVAFVLTGNGHEYLVDLRDGHFEIDGVEFNHYSVPDQEIDPMQVNAGQKPKLGKFKLVYFRPTVQKMNADVRINKHGIPEMGNPKITGEVQRNYCIGWQAKDIKTGKNYQQVIQII